MENKKVIEPSIDTKLYYSPKHMEAVEEYLVLSNLRCHQDSPMSI